MSHHHEFTDRVRDLSDSNGYQFEFVCERCGSAYRSPLVHDKVDLGRALFRALGDLIGGPSLQLATVAARHDEPGPGARHRAVQRAVETVREEFRQCSGCGDWVCDDTCWHESGRCLTCAASVGRPPA